MSELTETECANGCRLLNRSRIPFRFRLRGVARRRSSTTFRAPTFACWPAALLGGAWRGSAVDLVRSSSSVSLCLLWPNFSERFVFSSWARYFFAAGLRGRKRAGFATTGFVVAGKASCTRKSTEHVGRPTRCCSRRGRRSLASAWTPSPGPPSCPSSTCPWHAIANDRQPCRGSTPHRPSRTGARARAR